MYEMEKLKQLVTFKQLGTLSQTAQVLHISQPALSKSMQRLEEILDVRLFERHKNRIELTATGILAAEYAEELLKISQKFATQLRQYDRNQRALTIGSCAPLPIWELSPLLYRLFPETSITTTLQSEEHLIQEVLGGNCQMAVTSFPADDDRLKSCRYLKEQLYFVLPSAHPLSKRSGVYFEELDGETVLQLTHIGIWEDLPKKKLPHSRILLLDEHGSYYNLLQSTSHPAFTTNLALKYANQLLLLEHTAVPILDQEACISYYCTFRKNMEKRLHPLLQELNIIHSAGQPEEI